MDEASTQTVDQLQQKLKEAEAMNDYYRAEIDALHGLIDDIQTRSDEYRREAQRLSDKQIA